MYIRRGKDAVDEMCISGFQDPEEQSVEYTRGLIKRLANVIPLLLLSFVLLMDLRVVILVPGLP